MEQAFIDYGIYDVSGHYLFFLLITAHCCLFIDISPLQKKSLSTLNYWIAIAISAAIPSILTTVFNFPSLKTEVLTGLAVALLLCFILTLSLQHFFKYDKEFW